MCACNDVIVFVECIHYTNTIHTTIYYIGVFPGGRGVGNMLKDAYNYILKITTTTFPKGEGVYAPIFPPRYAPGNGLNDNINVFVRMSVCVCARLECMRTNVSPLD